MSFCNTLTFFVALFFVTFVAFVAGVFSFDLVLVLGEGAVAGNAEAAFFF